MSRQLPVSNGQNIYSGVPGTRPEPVSSSPDMSGVPLRRANIQQVSKSISVAACRAIE